ncbi:hypothetical protein GTY80_37020, partial [Amycolatopsis sp. SID8362]|nr:hypothetical protein [Amycolatopsis sp. SID8362]
SARSTGDAAGASRTSRTTGSHRARRRARLAAGRRGPGRARRTWRVGDGHPRFLFPSCLLRTRKPGPGVSDTSLSW